MNKKETTCSCCSEHAHRHSLKHDHEHSHAHACGCEHAETNLRTLLLRGSLGLICFVGAFFATDHPQTILFLAAYLIFGYDVLFSAGKRILSGKFFDEAFLMSVASLGAICIGEYPEAAAVMLFYQLGEYLQDRAVEHSERSVRSLMQLRPDTAYREIDGVRTAVPAESVEVGSILLVSAGERIPLDGVVIEGESYLDTACLTGESVPRRVRPGDSVQSGAINQKQLLKIRTEKTFHDSTASKILELMEHTAEKKAKHERFITGFAQKYTPIVILLAVLLGIVPPFLDDFQFSKWILRALNFLVVSCPCALVISVPLSFFAGIGCASKNGIILKNGDTIEKLATLDTFVFDKTGTLTEGVFEITALHSALPKETFLELCAYAELYSNHPIAEVLKKHAPSQPDSSRLSAYREFPGKGVSVLLDGEELLLGNAALMEEHKLCVDSVSALGTVLFLAKNRQYLGYVIISDKLRESAAATVSSLKDQSFRTVMLTGDRTEAAQNIASLLGIDEIHTQLLPQDKAEIMENLSQTHHAAFIGDGINDAPVLALSEVGFAMGGIGQDAAIEAADAILMTDDLQKLSAAVRLSKNTLKIVRQNIVFAIGVKLLILLLCAFGKASMWAAVFADVGVSLLAVLNAMRALYQKI